MFGRLTRGSVAASTLLVGAAITFTPLITSADAALVTTIPGNYFTVVDSQGVNDENGGGQLELTQMGRDDSDASFYQIFWSWDGTDFQSQTGDACALFDSDGDGNINFNICGQIENGAGSTIVQTNNSPTAHNCGDAKDDRCTTPADVTPGAGELVAGPIQDLSDTGGNLVTATDPFHGQVGAAADPNDSTIAAKIKKSLMPPGAQLVNVCDYESIAGGGNNNPNDCIVNPGGGYLSIVKETTGGDDTFDFTAANDSNTPKTIGRSITTVSGSGTAAPVSMIVGAGTSVSETVPATWTLTNAACTLQDGGGATGTFDSANHKVTGVTIESGKITTCTFQDLQAHPGLSLDKSTTSTGYDSVGDTIDYTYRLTNTGNVPLDAPYTVDDDVVNGAGDTVSCPSTPDPLIPNAHVDCTATYTVTQADLDAGKVKNTAQGHASYGGDPVDSNEDDVTVLATQTKQLTLDKSTLDTSFDEVGDVLSYTYELTNTGNVTLHAPYSVDDDVVDGAGGSVDCPLTPADLAPGDPAVVCTATYTVTQADLDAGQVFNTAKGHATLGNDTVDSNEDTALVPALQDPKLVLDKTATETSYDAAGQTLHYFYALTNTGNVTLHAPYTVDDDVVNGAGGTVDCPSTPADFAPGDPAIVCTATYNVTQADVDAGSVTNTAEGHATLGNGKVDSNEDSVEIPAVQTPSLHLDKDATESSYDTVGQVLHYSYTLTNDGNVTLSSPYDINDDVITDDADIDCSAGPASLAPGESFACIATYTVTQADLDSGSVTNIATATATRGGDTVESNEASATVPAEQNPALKLHKAVDKTSAGYGDTLTYTLTATNTGNVSLTGVVVGDDIPEGTTYVDGSAKPKASFDSDNNRVEWAVGDMAPGESRGDLTFQVTIDQPDFDSANGLPAEVIDNVGVIRSDTVEPSPSNHVKTTVVAVLGVKVTRPPHSLPFTGMPVLGALVLAAACLGFGVLSLVVTKRRRHSA